MGNYNSGNAGGKTDEIHHINLKHKDNRKENLILLTQPEHCKVHKELRNLFLKLYGNRLHRQYDRIYKIFENKEVIFNRELQTYIKGENN